MTKPVWLKMYELAVLETDDAILEGRIVDAEKAIQSRLEEVARSSEDPTVIHAAAKALQILREERLRSGSVRKQGMDPAN